MTLWIDIEQVVRAYRQRELRGDLIGDIQVRDPFWMEMPIERVGHGLEIAAIARFHAMNMPRARGPVGRKGNTILGCGVRQLPLGQGPEQLKAGAKAAEYGRIGIDVCDGGAISGIGGAPAH